MQVVKELEEVEVLSAAHPRRRIIVLLRDDGNFSFAEQYHYSSEYEGNLIAEGWATLSPNGIYASSEVAEAEGQAMFATWHNLPR